MLLKFTSADMLNTTLIDVVSGEVAYDIVTNLRPDTPVYTKSQDSSIRSSSAGSQIGSTKASPKTPRTTSSPKQRETRITDAEGNLIAGILWTGRHPNITIADEKIGGLTEFFGSNTVRFMPKILVIPTRFDTELMWTASSHSLTLINCETETVMGEFHQNAIRIPKALKIKKSRPSLSTLRIGVGSTEYSDSLSSPSSSSFSSASSCASPSSPSSSLSSLSSTPPISPTKHRTSTPFPSEESAFLQTHVPGLGGNYLEFVSQPLAHDVEIIISFIIVEILRRGRFNLTPYSFDKPKLWQLNETKDYIVQRMRRHTV